MQRALVLNGPNLNLLGLREPDVYGTTTLAELEEMVAAWGRDLGLDIECEQSNHEGELIDLIQGARDDFGGIVLNAGALTHYSYAIHDAILASGLPAVEVHISNIRAREEWRRVSVIAPACEYVVYGRGLRGYRDALARLATSDVFPPMAIHYGEGPHRLGELRVPVGAGPHPVAALFHGGFWRDQWTRDLMDGLAVDLVERGFATWNIEYRRLGSGGGWPLTLLDVAASIDALAGLATEHALDLDRVTAVGHSAGGQLALWSVARPDLYQAQPPAEPKVVPVTAVTLAGVNDLAAAHRLDLGAGAVEEFLRRTPDDGSSRFASASPMALLPLGARQIVAHGAADEVIPVDLSREYAAAARDAGDEVTLVVIDAADHFDVIDPAGAAWKQVAAALAR
ncbi:MAG: type II 3-dehydroquinate dehydratase [Acidimicrobiia bacterium]